MRMLVTISTCCIALFNVQSSRRKPRVLFKNLIKFSAWNEAKDTENRLGGVAQWLEHLLCKQDVEGSSPFASTNLQLSNKTEQPGTIAR